MFLSCWWRIRNSVTILRVYLSCHGRLSVVFCLRTQCLNVVAFEGLKATDDQFTSVSGGNFYFVRSNPGCSYSEKDNETWALSCDGTRWFWSQSLESLDFEDLYSIRKMCIHLLEMKSVKAFFEHSSGFLWFFVGKYITRYLHHLQLQVTSSLILAKFGQLISPFRAWYSLEGKSTPGRRLTFINNSYYFTYKGRCF